MISLLRNPALVFGSLLGSLLCAGAAPQAIAQTTLKSGYALADQRCGEAPNAYPKLRIGMRDGYCAGLVASEEDGLIFPRSIVAIPGHRQFVVADMGSWNPGQGRLLLLDPDAPQGKRISVLIGRLDFPFGLQTGPDGKVYASTSETIFRFDPLASNPKSTVETIIQKLPGRKVTLSDGSVVEESVHPLKAFVFDKTGRIFVNVGAPTDSCLKPITKPCVAGEGAAPFAAIWAFTPPPGGIFPALKPDDPNPAREIYARGLRNSMALAVHPEFPGAGFAFLQGENGRDLLDPSEPNEEINAIERGKHYGWPYCYDLSTPSPEFRSYLASDPRYRNFCASTALYRPPLSLLPPHAAPLALFFYGGGKFAELQGKLVIGLHGYRPTGSRIIFYDVDDKGFPKLSPPPVRYHVSCAAEPSRAFQTGKTEVAAAPFTELVSEWHKVNGVRPQGAPVGMTVASDGAIWLVEDHNKTIIRIDQRGGANAGPAAVRCPVATGDRRTRQIRPGRPRAEPKADDDPYQPRREALSELPFGLRIEARACGKRERRNAPSIPVVPGWLAVSRRFQIRPAACAPQWHRLRADHAARPARRPRPDGARGRIQAAARGGRSVRRQNGSGAADAHPVGAGRPRVPGSGGTRMRRNSRQHGRGRRRQTPEGKTETSAASGVRPTSI